MKCIFLDIDGVLNNARTKSMTPDGFTGISNSLLNNLKNIVQITNAKIILTSTWKSDWDINIDNCTQTGIYLNKKFSQKKLYIFDKVRDASKGSFYRGLSIIEYIKYHSNITDFVIIDDSRFDFDEYIELKNHIVYTNELLGLTIDKVEEAIKIIT